MFDLVTYVVTGFAVVLFTVDAQVLTPASPAPMVTYICTKNAVNVSFAQNQTNGLTYQRVSIDPHRDVPECFTDNVNSEGMFELHVTNFTACGITPDASGMANFLVRIHYLTAFDTHQDTLTNITCNVTDLGAVPHTISTNFSVSGVVIVVPGSPSSLPVIKLIALANLLGTLVSSVQLGSRFWLCLEIDFSRSLYKGALVDDVYTTNPNGDKLYLIQNGCQRNGVPQANVGFPTTNATTLNIYIELIAFRFFKESAVVFGVKVTFSKHEKIQGGGNTCVTKRKRSADDEDKASHVYTMTIPVTSSNDNKIITREDMGAAEKPQDKNNKNPVCKSQINATIFYVVVTVLASLLLLMIGVVVVFGRRAGSSKVV